VGAPLRHPWTYFRAAAFSPDGKRLATGCHPPLVPDLFTGSAQLWDASSGKPLHAPLALTNYVSSVAFSPDGKVLATGDYHQFVRLWDVATGQPKGLPWPQNDIVMSLAFSPDGRTLAAGTAEDRKRQPQARLWDVATGRPIGAAMPHAGAVDRVSFSLDGKTLLTANQQHLQLWDAATGQPRCEPLPRPGRWTTFSPDGRLIVTGAENGTARLWDGRTGRPIEGATLLHPSAVTAVAFSPDSRLVLTGCEDGSARLWDVATMKPLGPPVGWRSRVLGVAFRPDGRSFVTANLNGQVRAWPVPQPWEDEDPDLLALRLQVRTGLQMDAGQAVTLLRPDEWEERRRSLVQLEGSAERAYRSAVSEADWLDSRARDAEADGDAFAALWHLDRLVALRPDDWLPYARRARVHSGAGRLDQAAADYARARERRAGEGLRHWYHHRAASCQAAGQWATALWYLDRVQQDAPGDWSVYRDRADVLAKLDKPNESEAAAARAVDLGADALTVLRLAESLAGPGNWARAAKLLGRLGEKAPASAGLPHKLALARLMAGDGAGYRRMCAERLAALPKDNIPLQLAYDTVRLFALGPGAANGDSSVVVLAEKVLAAVPPAGKHLVLNPLGAVLYRAGRYSDAAARLNEAVAAHEGTGKVKDWLFLAMAHHRQGHADEAKKWLGKVTATPTGDFWADAEVELLRREARALIERK
jgi:predicted Zn-dependent protease